MERERTLKELEIERKARVAGLVEYQKAKKRAERFQDEETVQLMENNIEKENRYIGKLSKMIDIKLNKKEN